MSKSKGFIVAARLGDQTYYLYEVGGIGSSGLPFISVLAGSGRPSAASRRQGTKFETEMEAWYAAQQLGGSRGVRDARHEPAP